MIALSVVCCPRKLGGEIAVARCLAEQGAFACVCPAAKPARQAADALDLRDAEEPTAYTPGDTKPCILCGTPFGPRANRIKDWGRRQHCSIRCWRLRMGYSQGTKARKTCSCGAVTQSKRGQCQACQFSSRVAARIERRA